MAKNKEMNNETLILTTKEVIEKYGNEAQKRAYAKNGKINRNSKLSLLKTLNQHFGFVSVMKDGAKNKYILKNKRTEKIAREFNYTFDNEFYEFKNVVYKATNLMNGKIYIGSTVTNLGMRISRHKYVSTHETERGYYREFSTALREFGLDNFKFEILEVVNVSEHLRKVESAYIYYFQSYKNEIGYNSVIGAGVDTTKLKGDNK